MYIIDSMSVFNFEKITSVSVFVCFPSVVVGVCVLHNQSGYLAFRTARIKDSKLTLAIIPF